MVVDLRPDAAGAHLVSVRLRLKLLGLAVVAGFVSAMLWQARRRVAAAEAHAYAAAREALRAKREGTEATLSAARAEVDAASDALEVAHEAADKLRARHHDLAIERDLTARAIAKRWSDSGI